MVESPTRGILSEEVGKNSRVCTDNFPDVEEEFILQIEMKKLMIAIMIDDFQSDDESSEDEVVEIPTVPVEKEKKDKQSQITDFFGTNK